MQKYNNNTADMLCRAFLSMRTMEECRSFIEDICTIQEIEALAQRFDVALKLSLGKSYSEVNELTGASTATICRVSKCVNYGSGGYQVAIERVGEGGGLDK